MFILSKTIIAMVITLEWRSSIPIGTAIHEDSNE